jgi:hypothetical protein
LITSFSKFTREISPSIWLNMHATFIISLLPLIRVFVELSQTHDNPDIRRHLIFSKSYFGQEWYYLSKIIQGIRIFLQAALIPGKGF